VRASWRADRANTQPWPGSNRPEHLRWAAAIEARLARFEKLLEGISATLTKTTDEPPGSPAGGSRNSRPIGSGGWEHGGRDRGAGAAARGRPNAEQGVEYNDEYADTMYKQALLGTLGWGRKERDPGMLDVVLRARQ
jgi:hypothetical protein